jgi:serralysin
MCMVCQARTLNAADYKALFLSQFTDMSLPARPMPETGSGPVAELAMPADGLDVWSAQYAAGNGSGSGLPVNGGGSSGGIDGVALTGDQNIDGLIAGMRWSASSLTFAFPTSQADYGTNYGDQDALSTFAPVNAAMQAVARATFAMVQGLTNLSFVESNDPLSAVFRMGISSEPNTAYAYYPSTSSTGGDSWYNPDPAWTQPIFGNYGYLTIIHELGHNLGLKHGHESDGPSGQAMNYWRDSMEFSVMTYRGFIGADSQGGYTNGQFGYAQTFMMYDIAALQHLYGADFGTQGGNTVYTFDPLNGQMFIDGVGQGIPGEDGDANTPLPTNGNRIFRTVWDGNGTDLYDFSNYATNQLIDLRPGYWSRMDDQQTAVLDFNTLVRARGNVFNALQYQGDTRSLIENANGGSGADSMRGNAGRNTLDGQGGDDTINGGGEADVLNGGSGNDRLVGDGPASQLPPLPSGDPGVGSTGPDIQSISAPYTNLDAGSALNLTNNFSLNPNGQIASSTEWEHTTVSGGGGTTALWFRVDVASPGVTFVVDVDVGIGTYDSFIWLLGPDGLTVLAQNDDSSTSSGGSGSTRPTDSFLTYTATAAGTYYARLGQYAPAGGDQLQIPPNVAWQLHISVYALPPEPRDNGFDGGGFGNDTLNGGDGADTLEGLDGNDRLDGGAGNDSLVGWTGNDTMLGGAGNDTLSGGVGTDSLLGGGGNDLYIVDMSVDVVVELANEGDDTVQATSSVIVGDHVENITLLGSISAFGTGGNTANRIVGNSANNALSGLGGADTLEGNDGNDSLLGGDGNDSLSGGGGNDTLNGGTGLDTLRGGAGDDRYVVGAAVGLIVEAAGEGNDTVEATVSVVLGDNVETLVLAGALAINGTGSSTANRITGNAAANVLSGLGGNDVLDGGGGDDSLLGGDGNDSLEGGAGNDTLSGGSGTDSLVGGVGDDRYVVAAPGAVIVELAAEGTDTVEASVSMTLGDQVETLVLVGAAAINGTGGSTANRITGNSAGNALSGLAGADLLDGMDGNDTIDGGTDNDSILGGAGNDSLLGRDGDDTMVGNAGVDTLLGGAGNDLYVVSAAGATFVESFGQGTDTVEASVSVTISNNIETLVLVGSAAIDGTGSNTSNRITGNSAANLLSGLDSNDTLSGGTGNDTLLGGSGSDLLFGGIGNDSFDGGIGGDQMLGEAGDDTMAGGTGNDTYFVSDAGDVVIENEDEGTDRIRLTASSYTVSSWIEDVFYNGTGNASITGGATNNRISGGAGSDTILGGDGRDLLYGEDGNDSLLGGEGNDQLYGRAGIDTLAGGVGNDSYIVTEAADVVIEAAGEGLDRVFASGDYTLSDNLEELRRNGSGSGTLTGNDSANRIVGGIGADTLVGLGGNDTLEGGDGADRFVFSAGNGADVIRGFEAGTAGADVIQFSTATFADYAAVQAAMSFVDGATVIAVSPGNSITLVGVQVAALNAGDFAFVA